MEFLARDAGKAAEKYSTRGFGESRHELIERLLDPPLTLEETARLLGVCPTTVRRYTNKGVLSHFRTAGNQRRFRLSDIVAFVESHLLAQGPSPGQDPVPAADERTAEAPAPKRRRTEASPQKTRTPKRARSTPALKKAPARKRTSEVAKPSR
jgi:excisionase family DNA binding protein